MINSPIPHSDRVPCKYDKVDIPSYSTRMKMNFNVDISVSSLEIDGIEHDQTLIDTFLKDSVGKLIINNPFGRRILISNQSCTDTTGCACGNDNKDNLYRICSFYINRCADLQTMFACSIDNQIQPEGFCCPICGTYLTMKYQTRFDYSLLENLIRILLSSHAVKFYASKTSNKRIQIVIIDDDNKSALSAAIKLKETLQLDNHYRLSNIQLFSSSISENDAKDYTVYLIISGIALLIFGVTLIVYNHNRVIEFTLIDHIRMNLRSVRRDSIAADFVRFQEDKIELRSGSDKWTPSQGSASSLSDNNQAFPKETLLNEPGNLDNPNYENANFVDDLLTK